MRAGGLAEDTSVPFDARHDLTEAKCLENLRRLRGQIGATTPSPELLQAATTLPTTHTFGLHSSADSIFDAGLVCVQERDPAALQRNAEEWEEKVEIGLQHYVFSYHGIHQPWYARARAGGEGKDLIPKPIGIFLSVESEAGDLESGDDAVRRANATFRDVAVGGDPGSGIERPFENYFLRVADARRLCAEEAAATYGGRFWGYWGDAAELASDADLRGNIWKQFYEMHFLSRVVPEAFLAVLFPLVKTFDPATGDPTTMVVDGKDLLRLIRHRCPSTYVGFYNWTSRNGQGAFCQASHQLAERYLNTGSFAD